MIIIDNFSHEEQYEEESFYVIQSSMKKQSSLLGEYYFKYHFLHINK